MFFLKFSSPHRENPPLVPLQEAEVRSRMLEYERDPRNFGVQGAKAADTSRYGLQQGYKEIR